MKRRITKTKLLAKLTKLVNAARKDYRRAGVWSNEWRRAESRYNALLEVRDLINMHRI